MAVDHHSGEEGRTVAGDDCAAFFRVDLDHPYVDWKRRTDLVERLDRVLTQVTGWGTDDDDVDRTGLLRCGWEDVPHDTERRREV